MNANLTTEEVIDYLNGIGGMFLHESDLSYKFSVMSEDDYNGVIGYFFLLGYNVGKSRPSVTIPSWRIGRIYKDGAEPDEEEEKQF